MKTMRKLILPFLIITMIIGMILPCSLKAEAYTFTPPFTIKSNAGIIMNLDSGTVIYEKNADHQEMPAHLAQIMTAIVVMENCSDIDNTTITLDIDADIYFQNLAASDDIRYAEIGTGDTLTVTEYLYAMLLTSGCDAAYALSNFIGNGSTEAFVKMMNDKAVEIGCTGTHFVNATGLYDKYQITTARDMMLITKYALEKVPGFREIATANLYNTTSKSKTVSYAMNGWAWKHSNTMTEKDNLFYYEGASGIKTGNLNDYGRNLITLATRDGITYLVILLGAPFEDEEGELRFYHIEDAEELLDWAFASFQYMTLIGDDQEIAELPVTGGSSSNFVLVKPESSLNMLWCKDVDISAVQKVPTYNENISAPIKKGDVLGNLELKFSGEVIASTPLVAVSDVDRSVVKHNISAFTSFFTESGPGSTFHVSLIFASLLSVAYILLCIYSLYAAKQKQKTADAIHIVPKSAGALNNNKTVNTSDNKKAWKRSDPPVFYHNNFDKREDE